MTLRWVVDEVEVVHCVHCMMIHGKATNYVSAAKTIDEMVANLARPDYIDRHFAPSVLVPCDQCLLGLPVEEPS